MSSFIAKLEFTMSELWELCDITFSDAFMISKLIFNLFVGFDVFVTTWKSTFKEDYNLTNLKLKLWKKEKEDFVLRTIRCYF